MALSYLMVLLQLQISLSPCCCRVRAAAEVLRLLLRAKAVEDLVVAPE